MSQPPTHSQKTNTNRIQPKQIWQLIFIIGLLAGLVLRLYLAIKTNTPGLWDAAFYYTVAKNIVLGRGLVIDYIWHYVNGPPPLTHYSCDYWHPLTSYILALPMYLFGISPTSGILASITAGLGMALISFKLGKIFGLSLDGQVMAATLAFFSPYSIQTSVATDTIIFFGLSSITVLYYLHRANKDFRFALVAAIFSGLGHLIRQDGILLLGTILTCILLLPLSVKRKLVLGVGVIGIHLVTISPLLIKNYLAIGFLFPPGPPSTRYLTNINDIYAFNKSFTFQTYITSLGWQGIIHNKVQTAIFHLKQAYAMLNPGFVVLVCISLINAIFLKRNRQRLYFFFPIIIYSTYIYGFYILIASFHQFSAQKSLVTLIPFMSILIIDFMLQRLRYRPVLIGLWLGLSFYLGVQGFARATWSIDYFDATYASMKATQPLILEDVRRRGQQESTIIVMSNDPWHFFEATGWHTLMIPNNDLETILAVANLYHATHLILPAPRPALDEISKGKIVDPRIEYIGTVDENKIYNFQVISK